MVAVSATMSFPRHSLLSPALRSRPHFQLFQRSLTSFGSIEELLEVGLGVEPTGTGDGIVVFGV